MKKTTVILMMVVLVVLLFFFQNIYSLFKGYEQVGVRDQAVLMENLKTLKNLFSNLSVITGLLLIGIGIYLIYLFRKGREKTGPETISPLHDYLMQLKNSESQLKDIVEIQQEKVTQKEELSKNIINYIDAAIIFLDTSGRIEIFNSVAEKLFFQSYANAKNNTLGTIFARFPEMVRFIDQHEDEKVSDEVTSGDRIYQVHLNPINGIGDLIFITDITEEKKREEIDRRNSNFIMLGEMTAFLAHEVRNSLGVIYGYTKTIKSEKEKIEKINKEILFLTDMMQCFLNFSKPVTIEKKEEIDLAELLKDIAAEKGITVEISGKPAMYENDASLIYSIFSNLLLNAKEAGADLMKVSFKLKKDEKLEITLTDNGKGIEPKNREKIWFPFFTTRDKGTGMGLPIIRKIINSLNGEILLKDSNEIGTSFKIIFYYR